LETLQKKGITQITAVVVRYFGGTLLGTGGLVRAYTDAVLAALEQATLCELTELDEYEIHFDYSLINAVDSYFAKHKITVTDKQYEDTAIYRFATAKDISSDLAEISSGKIKPHFLRKITIESRI
jgi:putative IMPACT (imprinted ancient) family translation regulator